MNYTIDGIWDLLISYNVATEDELKLVTNINGYSIETLLDILYARTALRSIDQLMKSK